MTINTKTEVIQVRVSKDEKKQLMHLASAANMDLSAYMRLKSLSADSDFLKSLPDSVEAWNRLNDLFHEIKKSDSQQLIIAAKQIINNQEESK